MSYTYTMNLYNELINQSLIISLQISLKGVDDDDERATSNSIVNTANTPVPNNDYAGTNDYASW